MNRVCQEPEVAVATEAETSIIARGLRAIAHLMEAVVAEAGDMGQAVLAVAAVGLGAAEVGETMTEVVEEAIILVVDQIDEDSKVDTPQAVAMVEDILLEIVARPGE